MEGASVMRLFLAILFEEPVKDRLCEAMELIRRSTRTSRLTRRENLHLTLVFLGSLVLLFIEIFCAFSLVKGRNSGPAPFLWKSGAWADFNETAEIFTGPE